MDTCPGSPVVDSKNAEDGAVRSDLAHAGSEQKHQQKRQGKKQQAREFDWEKATFARFVLKIAYVGTNYHGLAIQELPSCPTVEEELFKCLVKARLIKDRQSCTYSRCGRTDRGVHAAGNYIALDLRVKPVRDDQTNVEDYDYPSLLNGLLPGDIRIIAAARVPTPDFDARFSCTHRTYKYYFPLAGEDLAKMLEASQHFVGGHDFRNFCKMDLENVTHFRRRMISVDIQEQPGGVAEITIVGQAFLWHQVRCMVAVLLLVGQGLEEPGIVDSLLDVEKVPRKPLYDMADESGLVLYDCNFPGLTFLPKKDGNSASVGATGTVVVADPASADSYLKMRAQASRMYSVHTCLASSILGEEDLSSVPRKEKPRYTPLLRRATCPSLEERQAALEVKRRRKGEASTATTAAESEECLGED